MSVTRSQRHTMWPLERMWPEDRFEQTFRDMFRNFFTGEGGSLEHGVHPMRLEELLEDDTLVIRAELPGMDPEKDVEIEVADGMLHIRAEREERSEEERGDGYRSEFRYGSFVRAIRLPEGTTDEDITASYKDGILEVRVPAPPKAVEKSAARIPIQKA